MMGITEIKQTSHDIALEKLESQQVLDDADKVDLENISNAASANNSVHGAATCAVLGTMALFSWINGDSQGRGFGNDEMSISSLQWLSLGYLGTQAASLYAYFLGTVSSFVANFEQASDYLLEDKTAIKTKAAA